MTVTELVHSIERLPADMHGACIRVGCIEPARYVFIGPEYELCATHLIEYIIG